MISIEKIFKFIFFCALLLLIILLTGPDDRLQLGHSVIQYHVAPCAADPQFKPEVERIIARSELRTKFKLQPAANVNNERNDATITIEMPSKEEMDKEYADDATEHYAGQKKKQIRFSYTTQGPKMKPKIYIDPINWQGVPESGLSLNDYRTYVIQHELMHALGFDHQECNAKTASRGVCPLMYQSTRGPPSGEYRCGFNPIAADFAIKLDGRFIA